MTIYRSIRLIALAALVIGSVGGSLAARGTVGAGRPAARDGATIQVSGSGVDFLNTAIVHTQDATPTGLIQRSTETVDLTGDLTGRVLYHVTSVFDFVHGTLVNTGDQVFSGSVAGSAPVMIHDDQFRFVVNLVTGAEHGQVFLFDQIAGPKVRCALDVTGTGLNAQGNPTFDYTGACTFRGQ